MTYKQTKYVGRKYYIKNKNIIYQSSIVPDSFCWRGTTTKLNTNLTEL